MEDFINPWYYSINRVIIKQRKPCLPNDLVHLIGIEGTFRVVDVDFTSFTIIKNNDRVKYSWESFKCISGSYSSAWAIHKRNIKDRIDNLEIEIGKKTVEMIALKKSLTKIKKQDRKVSSVKIFVVK